MMQPRSAVRDAIPGDRKAWDLLADHPLQSWAWGEFREKTGVYVVRRVTETSGHLSACWQLTFHRIPHTPFTVGYFPKGKLPTKQMLDDCMEIGKRKRALYIQIEPQVPVGSRTKIPAYQHLVLSHRPLFTTHTFLLDLTKAEDQLLAAMNQKTRYNIRLAQKHGVTVQEDNSSEAFGAYLRLTEETTARQKFFAHRQRYHQLMWETLRSSGIAHLFTATYKQTILAAWILLVWKDTLYYPYGASSRDYREVMAPNLMLWKTALWGKNNGLKLYDLWGALGPKPDIHDPWYGFHRFKEGYAPDHVEYVGSYDLIVNTALYPLFRIADAIRWRILRLL